MRVVVQRVRSGSVSVDDAVVAAIERGLVALVGVARDDDLATAAAMGRKLARLRIFDRDGDGRERSVAEIEGSLLCVSQFTLLADTRRGNRPSWSAAADRATAEPLVAAVAASAHQEGVHVVTGRFGSAMVVTIENDGPVTLVLDAER